MRLRVQMLLYQIASLCLEKLNAGYIILQHMLNTLSISSRSIPFSRIITCILKYFRVPLAELSHKEPKELGDNVITSLVFAWVDNQWVRNQNLLNKPTEMALFNHRIFNNVFSPDQVPDLNIFLQAKAPSCHFNASYHTYNALPPSSSVVSNDLMQQLLNKVHFI